MYNPPTTNPTTTTTRPTIIFETKDFVLHEALSLFQIGFSKPTSNQDETFPTQTPMQRPPQALLLCWFLSDLHAQDFTFSFGCQNEPTKFHLFIQLPK